VTVINQRLLCLCDRAHKHPSSERSLGLRSHEDSRSEHAILLQLWTLGNPELLTQPGQHVSQLMERAEPRKPKPGGERQSSRELKGVRVLFPSTS
jgi:hypothetical protein